jgi:hypothetical protein
MVDRYTKVVLTVIAAALVMLAMRPWREPQPARAQGSECGNSRNPCFVTTGVLDPLRVQVTNWPSQGR